MSDWLPLSPAEHYLAAERHIEAANETTEGNETIRFHLALAQIHATLALASNDRYGEAWEATKANRDRQQ